MLSIPTNEEIEAEVQALDLEEVRSRLRDIVIEQHKGKWIYQGEMQSDGKPKDPKDHELFHEYVRSRVCLGIALTAKDRAIQSLPASAKGSKSKSTRGSKESIAAAITEDLLS